MGASLAYAGLTMALAQMFVTRRLIPKIGERRAILLGLTVGLIGFFGNALVPQGWMIYVVLSFSALQGLVFPSMNSTLSKQVSATEQGELQGGVASLQSVAAIIGPPVMTQALSFFTRVGAPIHLPGAAFVLAGTLTLGSMIVIRFFARNAFPRRAA